MRALIIFLLLYSITHAGECETIDSFEGLKSEKKNGVIIIDYATGADKAALKEQAERSGRKSKAQWQNVHRRQEVDKAVERIKKAQEEIDAARTNYKNKAPAYSTPQKYEPYDSSEHSKDYYNKKLREIEAEERSRSYNEYEREAKERRKQRYKDKLKDIERNPEVY